MKKKVFKFLFFLFAVLTCIMSIGMICCVIHSFFNGGCSSDLNKIILIVEVIDCISTTILGIAAYWQTKQSNEINDKLFRKEVNCNLLPQSEVNVTVEKIYDIDEVVQFAKLHETEGLYCYDSNMSYYENDTRYIKIELKFRSVGDFVEDCFVKGVYLNESFEKDENLKAYYVKFKIANPNQRLVFRFNPRDKAYYLEIYIRYSPTLIEINEAEYFVLDLMLQMKSSYNTDQTIVYSFNFVKINRLEQLERDPTEIITVQLEDVSIHKNKLK